MTTESEGNMFLKMHIYSKAAWDYIENGDIILPAFTSVVFVY